MAFDATKLREQREALGLTQKQLARLLGVTRVTLNNYERGESEPQLKHLERLAAYFRKPVDYFLTDSPGGKPGDIAGTDHPAM